MGILYDVVCFPVKILCAVLDCVIAIACCPCRTCCGCPQTSSERSTTTAAPTDVV